MASTERVANLFHVLKNLFHVMKKIKARVAEAHDLTARAIVETDGDRELADAAGPDDTDIVELHELCCRLIDDRQFLAIALEWIRLDLEAVHIVPLTDNLGKKARTLGAK